MSKVIAIMDKPKNCDYCVFGVCKYSLPLSTNRKGYYCKLKGETVIEDFSFDEEVHLSNCPLRELPQKQTVHCTDTTHHRFAKDGWNHCIDTILKAGAKMKNFVEYKHSNGYSARLYGYSSMCIYFNGKEVLHTGSRNVNTETEVMKMLEDYPNLWSSLSNNIDEILADDEDSEV